MTSKITSIRISEAAIAKADALAEQHGISRSKLIEFLIEQSAAREEKARDLAHVRHKAALPFGGKAPRK